MARPFVMARAGRELSPIDLRPARLSKLGEAIADLAHIRRPRCATQRSLAMAQKM